MELSDVVVDLVGTVTPYNMTPNNMLGLEFSWDFSCKWKTESEMHWFQKIWLCTVLLYFIDESPLSFDDNFVDRWNFSSVCSPFIVL